jgi:exopolysaccharide biosynthesis protein
MNNLEFGCAREGGSKQSVSAAWPMVVLLRFLVVCGVLTRLTAAPSISEWEPLFKGVELMRGTNLVSAGDFQNRMAMYCLRIDLRDPDIRLLPSPRITNFVAGSRETAGMTVSRFVVNHGVQVAINANFFDPQEYYLPEGTPMYVSGLQVSGGLVVSPQNNSQHTASFVFDATNGVRVIHTNWPAISNEGIHNAVTGDYPVVVNGVNIGRQYLNRPGFIHGTNPRTAIGVSVDRRFLYLMSIDGRQDHSSGALDYETGAWMLLVGAYDAVNMDGGGSATMAMESSTGQAVRINQPSAVADSGKERTVGSHLGVFARPLPSYINDLTAYPDDISASVTWTTVEPGSSQLEYGPTTDLGQTTPVKAGPSTNHAALIRGLNPGTEYYYQAVTVSAVDGQVRRSTLRRMLTANYAVPEEVVAMDATWRFFDGGSQSGNAWTTPSYSDASWGGPGNGVLWVVIPSRNSPANGVEPVGTRVTGYNRSTGFPHLAYYFRTRFQVATLLPGTQLRFVGRIDDGAVVYLNGREIYRVRMPEAPAPIDPTTLAVTFPCGGDATCDDVFEVSGDGFLVAGENVLAVEAHNYQARSSDITMGLSLAVAQPRSERPVLDLVEGSSRHLAWQRGGFLLEEAPTPTGPWTEVPGPVVRGPHSLGEAGEAKFYRLAR